MIYDNLIKHIIAYARSATKFDIRIYRMLANLYNISDTVDRIDYKKWWSFPIEKQQLFFITTRALPQADRTSAFVFQNFVATSKFWLHSNVDSTYILSTVSTPFTDGCISAVDGCMKIPSIKLLSRPAGT